MLNGIRDQLGDHEFQIRDRLAAQCGSEANRRARDPARGQRVFKRQREFRLLQRSLATSEDLAHTPIDADEGVMGQADRPLTLEFVRLGSHHSLSVLGPVAAPPNGEHRVPDSTTSLGARVGPASNIAGSVRPRS
jgi:hypothetical protein